MQLDLPDFWRAIDNDPWNCVLFVGGGLSKSNVRLRGKGLPDWDTLMQHMIDDLQRDPSSSDGATVAKLQQYLKQNKHLNIAETFKKKKDPSAFAEFLRAELDPRDITSSKIHEVILRIGFRAIITTNFDCVFESQSRPPRRPIFFPLFSEEPWSAHKDKLFLKIHGCIRGTSNPAENLILTKKSYSALRSNEKYQLLMKTFLLQYPILTVGFSLRDPDFRSLVRDLKKVFGQTLRPIYALMLQPSGEPQPRLQGFKIIPYEKRADLLR